MATGTTQTAVLVMWVEFPSQPMRARPAFAPYQGRRPARLSGRVHRSWIFVGLALALLGVGLLSHWLAGAMLANSHDLQSDAAETDSIGEAFVAGPRTAGACLRAGSTDWDTGDSAALSGLFETLGRSETGAELLRLADARGVDVCIDRQTDLLAYYFAGMRVIGVNWALSEGQRIVFLAHELAHIPQHPEYSDNRYFPAADLLLLRRLREAVAEAQATRIAWELRAGGYDLAWDEKMVTPYADVAHAFAHTAEAATGDDGLLPATRAAFDQWFAAPWRRDVYDRMTFEHLRRISADDTGLVAPRRTVTAEYLIGIGELNGRNFLAGAGPLTDRRYTGKVSARNARRIQQLLQRAGVVERSAPSGPLAGVAS